MCLFIFLPVGGSVRKINALSSRANEVSLFTLDERAFIFRIQKPIGRKINALKGTHVLPRGGGQADLPLVGLQGQTALALLLKRI